jgi:type II secretory pathway predicted ATPase ExeA
MFEQHFGLTFNPFDKEIEPDRLFVSRDLKELSTRLKYMLNNRGICLLTGEPGAGKTTALRKFAASLNPATHKPCYLPLTTLTVNDFYQALAGMLGETPVHKKIALFHQIQGCIQTLYYEQRITPVFIIDEIHMAPNSILDDLRMLFSFKMDSANPFVMVLSGQPQIRNKFALNICYPLKQRIRMKYSMQGLAEDETAEYCRSRMKLAGSHADVFSQTALAAIHAASGGFLRNVNNIATASLLYCASKRVNIVDEEAVYQANAELSL